MGAGVVGRVADAERRRGSAPSEANAPVVEVEANDSGGVMCE